jgi:hypothetical protein
VQIKSSKFEIRIHSQKFKFEVLSSISVDRLTPSVIFQNLLELNQTLLLEVNLVLMTCSTVCKSTKIIENRKYLFQGSKQS